MTVLELHDHLADIIAQGHGYYNIKICKFEDYEVDEIDEIITKEHREDVELIVY